MSSEIELIVCRRCNETISMEQGSCPHCGATIRGQMYWVAIAFGVLLMGATVLNPGELLAFGILGLLLAGGAGYLVYEQRQRINEAKGESE